MSDLSQTGILGIFKPRCLTKNEVRTTAVSLVLKNHMILKITKNLKIKKRPSRAQIFGLYLQKTENLQISQAVTWSNQSKHL